MKNSIKILSLGMILTMVLYNCTHEVDQAYVVMRDNLRYEMGSDKPFSGNAVNYENGQLLDEVPYKDGLRHGQRRMWYRNGQLSGVITFKSGLVYGPTETWHENGQRSTIQNRSDGLADGKYEAWNEGGTKIIEIDFKGGKVHGLYKQWYENGKMMNKAEFIEGRIDGEFQHWYENGEKDLNIENVKGVVVCQKVDDAVLQAGSVLVLDHRNFLEISLPTRDGVYQSWYSDGQLEERRNYKNGKLHGLSQAWLENGKLRYEKNYSNGTLLK